jgi:two-component system, OmpR family, phosphate regulon sensor histidine kinase PhoR
MQKGRKLLWRLYFPYVMTSFVCLVALSWYAIDLLREINRQRDFAALKAQAVMLDKFLEERFSAEQFGKIDDALKEIAVKTQARLTVVLPSGRVVADSQEELSRLGDLSGRPEIREALKGKEASVTRHSFHRDAEWSYVAVPLIIDGRIVGVVRSAMPNTILPTGIPTMGAIMLAGALAIAILFGGVSLYLSRAITKPVLELKQVVAGFSDGDLKHRIEVDDWAEFNALTDATYSMAANLQQRLDAVTEQRNELEAVLTGMVEAVLVFDTKERIIRVNRAAERLFQIAEPKVKGRSVQEAVRNTELHQFVGHTLSKDDPGEREIVILGDPDVFLQAHGARLVNAQEQKIGGLVVLNDVTRLKALENIRRDFVANVSHELKTPITSIKGFLETLKEGAIKDPENAERFLDIIIRHTERLDTIIEDLLSLSRIERESERGEIALEKGSVREVIDAVGRACLRAARKKNISLECDVEEDLSAKFNARLLEQALVNLVDNAIKYSEPEKKVELEAKKAGSEIVITVRDQGCGIPKEHLQRIFERFYRVDKGRSRKEGGTGLGLSIVKHIVNSHRGRIDVESSPGRGSAFSIHLPVNG